MTYVHIHLTYYMTIKPRLCSGKTINSNMISAYYKRLIYVDSKKESLIQILMINYYSYYYVQGRAAGDDKNGVNTP